MENLKILLVLNIVALTLAGIMTSYYYFKSLILEKKLKKYEDNKR